MLSNKLNFPKAACNIVLNIHVNLKIKSFGFIIDQE